MSWIVGRSDATKDKVNSFIQLGNSKGPQKLKIVMENYKIDLIKFILFGFTACSYNVFLSYKFIFYFLKIVGVLHKSCLLSSIKLN